MGNPSRIRRGTIRDGNGAVSDASQKHRQPGPGSRMGSHPSHCLHSRQNVAPGRSRNPQWGHGTDESTAGAAGNPPSAAMLPPPFFLWRSTYIQMSPATPRRRNTQAKQLPSPSALRKRSPRLAASNESAESASMDSPPPGGLPVARWPLAFALPDAEPQPLVRSRVGPVTTEATLFPEVS